MNADAMISVYHNKEAASNRSVRGPDNAGLRSSESEAVVLFVTRRTLPELHGSSCNSAKGAQPEEFPLGVAIV